MKPTIQTATATQNTRRFHIRACVHRCAHRGSLVHAWGRSHKTQAVIANITADPVNIYSSYSANVTSMGNALVNAATTAPNPILTSRIGNAQHSSVPVAENRAIQLSVRCCVIWSVSIVTPHVSPGLRIYTVPKYGIKNSSLLIAQGSNDGAVIGGLTGLTLSHKLFERKFHGLEVSDF